MRLGKEVLGQVLTNGSLLVGAGGITTELPVGSPGRVLTVTSPGVVGWSPTATPSLALDDLTDVNTAGETAGQVLTFNGSEWTPVTPSGTVSYVGVSTDSNVTASGGPVTSSGTFILGLSNTGVVPGTYAAPNLTVDAKGRITNISNGSGFYLPTSGGTLTGNLTMADGDATNPGLALSSWPNTGIFATNSSDALRITVGGLEQVSVHNGAMKVPAGPTAEEPGTPIPGMIRFDTDTNEFKGWNGSAWVVLG